MHALFSGADIILRPSSCGEDIKNLERFVGAQRIAFQKILKKYKVSNGLRYFLSILPNVIY